MHLSTSVASLAVLALSGAASGMFLVENGTVIEGGGSVDLNSTHLVRAGSVDINGTATNNNGLPAKVVAGPPQVGLPPQTSKNCKGSSQCRTRPTWVYQLAVDHYVDEHIYKGYTSHIYNAMARSDILGLQDGATAIFSTFPTSLRLSSGLAFDRAW